MDLFNDIGKLFARPVPSEPKSEEKKSLDETLAEARRDLKEAYTALGRACYETTIQPRAVLPENLVSEVRMLRERVESLRKLQLESMESFRCPYCGSKQKKGRFCSNCGNRMPEASPELNQISVVDANATYCPKCGAMRNNDSEYCELCGSSFSAATIGKTKNTSTHTASNHIEAIEEPDYGNEE